MLHIIIHTLLDSLKLLPFLFVAFLIMEYLEHKVKNKDFITKNDKYGPVIGSVLGIFPQCGFSVSATNLFAAKVISVGTLVSIYLSTSDEMLPILISEKVPVKTIITILLIKILVGMLTGLLLNLFIKKDKKSQIKEICNEEHCDCEHGIFKSSLKHTLHIFTYIIIFTFILNILMHYLGEETISKILMKDTIFGPMLTSIVGLIPNCSSSVIITELYLNNVITFGSLLSGLLTGSGAAIMILFKENKNIKENLAIITIIYTIGAIVGLFIDIIGFSL